MPLDLALDLQFYLSLDLVFYLHSDLKLDLHLNFLYWDVKEIVTILLVIAGTVSNGQQKILIAAASDLKFAMDSVIDIFGQTHTGQVEITYGSSGKLTEQILQGAPFDLLLSADISYPEMLERAGQAGSAIYPYATGRIVVWSKKLDPREKQIYSLLDPSIVKIAIANPKHAPYGRRAVECLQHYGLLEQVESRLVYGENISQTAQFASAGAADIAIIALSIALSPNMENGRGEYFLIPDASHSPLIQGAVITRHGREKQLSRTFFDFLRNPKALEVMEYYGFTTP